ncbi:MAG: 2-amino-4-hydroxy-6-hydroxymethyldihydropteridine diphosphokinase [Cytophagales bacterium]
MEPNVFLLLGANLGDRAEQLQKAAAEIDNSVGTVLQKSSMYQTAAWGKQSQRDFYNQVLHIRTSLTAEAVLEKILLIEQKLGRQRNEKWGTRTIDIDILYFGSTVVNHPQLIIPHPAIATRRFTLVPLAEISPLFMHPVLQLTNAVLLQQCDDPLGVERLS